MQSHITRSPPQESGIYEDLPCVNKKKKKKLPNQAAILEKGVGRSNPFFRLSRIVLISQKSIVTI